MDDKPKDKATAIHEAGHAVAHVRLGIQQLEVTIESRGEILGHSTAEGVEHCWSKEQADSMALAYCAGYAASVASGCAEGAAEAGCDDDFDRAEELIEFWCLDDLATCKARAVELLRQPDNVAAVRLVADHLMRLRTLDVDYIDLLVDFADGNVTEAEFDQYLAFRRATGRAI